MFVWRCKIIPVSNISRGNVSVGIWTFWTRQFEPQNVSFCCMPTMTPQSFFEFFLYLYEWQWICFALTLCHYDRKFLFKNKPQGFHFAQNLAVLFLSKKRVHKIRIVDRPFWNCSRDKVVHFSSKKKPYTEIFVG